MYVHMLYHTSSIIIIVNMWTRVARVRHTGTSSNSAIFRSHFIKEYNILFYLAIECLKVPQCESGICSNRGHFMSWY